MTLHILPLLDGKSHNVRPKPDFSLEGFVLNDRYSFLRKIGAGTYGLIYLVRDQVTGLELAAKMVMTEPHGAGSAANNKKYIQEKMYDYFASHSPLQAQELDLGLIARDGVSCLFLKEIALHLKVHDHPNVVTIHHVFSLERFAVVTLMDYFAQGDLFGNIIDNHIFLTRHHGKQLMMKNCMLQLIDAVEFCALRGVYHCDLKPENVMVRYDPLYRRPDADETGSRPIIDYQELHVSLIDFGLAMTSDLICCNACRGSSFYMAPERIVNFNTSKLVRSLIDMEQFVSDERAELELSARYLPTLAGDVWLLGVLFINITCARNPWPIANINDRHEVFSNYILHNKSILQTILPILKQFNAVLNEIFCLNPNERISLADLRQRIVAVDFYHDGASFNEQLCTPPTEPNLRPSSPKDIQGTGKGHHGLVC